jgi:hypothetical protein
MKRLSVIALVFAVFATNAAYVYDYYWFGTASDGLCGPKAWTFNLRSIRFQIAGIKA